MKTKTFFSRMVWDTSQLLRKSLTSLKSLTLLLVMMVSVNVWGAEETIDVISELDLTASLANFTDKKVNDYISISSTKGGAGTATTLNYNSTKGVDLRLYKHTTGNAPTFTITATDATISKVEFKKNSTTASSLSSFSANVGTLSNNVWTGSASSVTFTYDNSDTNFKEQIYIINVTYSYEGAAKTLESIAISGTPTKTAYETGESFDVTGLTVTGTYSDASTDDLTDDAEWTIDPATFTSTSQTSVSVTATVDGKSDTKNYDVTVTEHVVTPGTYEIVPNNTFFGVEVQTTGSHGAVTGKQNDITIIHSGGSSFYCNASQVRTYKDNTLTFSVPEGYEITSIVLAVTDNASYNADNGTYTASSKTWAGHAQQVVLTSAQSSGNYQITKITVTYAAAKVLSSIAVKTAPTKTTYYVGDDFDPAGLVITASYTDESTEDIAYTEDNKDAFSFSGFNSEAEATDQVITVTYAEKSATFTVNIEEARVLNSIEVASNPSKMVYEVGEALDLTGLVVNGIFSKGDPEPVDYTADPADGAILDAVGNTTVTLTSVDNTELTTSFNVTVNAIEGDRITLAETGVTGTSYTAWTSSYTAPSGAVYTGLNAGGNSAIQLRNDASEAKPASGIISTTSGGLIQKVKVVWNTNTANDRELEVFGSNTAYTAVADLVDNTKKGTSLGTIKKGTSTELVVSGEYAYVGIRSKSGALYLDNVTFIWSAPKVLEGIAVKTAPTTVEYAAGEFFNPAGLVITATYDDESTEDITYEDNEDKFTFNPALDAALATTDEKVTITYGGKSCDQAITVKNIELTSIVVSGDLSKTDYTEGDDFDFTGLVATGYYSDESHKTITDQVDWSIYPATLTAGQTSVSVIATSGLINGNKSYDITVAAAPLEVTWDASEQGFSNEESVTEANFNAIISAEFDGGKYYTSGTAVRVYGGKTFAIHATSGYKITSIVIGFGSGDKSNEITADCGTYSNGTWTGSSKDVTFTVGGTKDHRRLMTFTVTYEEAAPSAATPTITPSVEAETYFDAITVTLATTTEGAAIYYTTNGDAPTIDPEHAYSEPFQVSATTTIKAIAVKDGLDDSEVATKKFTFGPIFTSLEDLAAADLTKGTTVKVSFENAEIKSIFVTQQGYRNGIYFDIQKGGKDIEIYYQNVPEDWKAGGIVSGTMTCPWTEYNGTWELAPAANSWDWTNLTYKDGESSKEQGTITATYKTSLDADAANDVYEVTYNGDGELSVVSSDPTVATATLEGTTVTIDPLKAGTTTITISAPATDNYTEASKNYTLTVSPALEAASLPFTFTGGKNDINPANGIKQEGLGSDYTAQGITTKLKFDHTDDYVLIWLADAPASMKFDIKGNSFSGGRFDVLESADNVNFTSLASYTEIEDGTKEMNLAATTRYIKFVYTSKSSGNVGLGNIHIAAPEPDFTREDLSNGQLITVCLDKNITKVEGGTFYQIEQGTTSEITFAEFAEDEFPIAKATPLLFQSDGTTMKVFCGTDQVADGDKENIVEHRAMKGIVNTATTPQTSIDPGNILVNNGQLRLVGENCVLTPGHAYIDVEELAELVPLSTPIGAPRRTIRLYNPDAQVPTNFNGLNGNMKAQKVMKDGQFYIIREAKMYNAQGIEVQ